MKALKYIRYILVSFIFLNFACSRDEVLISGDITGKIKMYNEDGYPLTLSGTPIKIETDSLNFQTETDETGWYTFENIPIGNYSVKIEKSGYVNSEKESEIQHVGGYSPTIQDFILYEIPKFGFHLDSISADSTDLYNDKLTFYGSLINSTANPLNWYTLWVFFGSSSEISSATYDDLTKAFIMNKDIDGTYFHFNINLYPHYQRGDTFYFRIYAAAAVPDWYFERFEILGPPSNVAEWVVNTRN